MMWVLPECRLFNEKNQTPIPIWCGLSARECRKTGALLSYHQEEDIPLQIVIDLVLEYGDCLEAVGFMHTSARIIGRCFEMLRR